MKPQRLFRDDQTECHNELGALYSQRVMAALSPVFEQAERDNICLRDLENIVNGDAMLMTSGALLRKYGNEPLDKR